jgi:hypothetical protein
VISPNISNAVPYPKCDVETGINSSLEEIIGGGKTSVPIFHLKPISEHYTKKVIERAQEGMARAEDTEKADTFNEDGMQDWLKQAYEPMALITDTKIHTVHKLRDLGEITPCMHIDLFLIETQIERARCQLQAAFEAKRYKPIPLLVQVILFLNDRYEKLVEGGRDNTFNDTGWSEPRAFDELPAGYYCKNGMCTFDKNGFYGSVNECIAATGCTEEYMCPFHSDYLPPTEIGSGSNLLIYGCTEDILKSYKDFDPSSSGFGKAISAEYEVIERAEDARDDLAREVDKVKMLADKINDWLDRPSEPVLNVSTWNRIPIKQLGCNENHYSMSKPPDPLPEPNDKGIYPDMDYDRTWPPKWPRGALRIETHGPFSLDKNNLRVLREYYVFRESWGKRRPLHYRIQDGLDDWSIWNPFVWVDAIVQSWIRGEIKRWDIEQEQMTSASITYATDAPRQLADQFQNLRASVGEFSRTASKMNEDTLRGFARDLAYFLRKSCIDRPCNSRLERLLKIIFEDKCFPYTDGSYRDNERLVEDCKSGL